MPSPKTIGIIPARWNSRRFPGKPLAKILGKSLIRRTYENVLQSSFLEEVAVATDDARIFDHVKAFGGRVHYSSAHCPTGTERVAEVVQNYYPKAEIVFNIQGDEPCLNPSVIKALKTQLHKHPQAFLTTAVTPITDAKRIDDPSVVKCVFNPQGKALYFSRLPIPFRQTKASSVYYQHIGVYCFYKKTLLEYPQLPQTPLQTTEDLEQLKIIENGYSIYVSCVKEKAIGVDSPEDIKKVEENLCKENTSLLPEASSLL